MNLTKEVTRYIRHKIHLADHSTHYLEAGALTALQYCHSLLQLFCYQKQYLTAQDVARFVLQNKEHLFRILPNPNNKSYKNSLERYNSMVAEAKAQLTPKTNQPLNTNEKSKTQP